MEQVKNAWIYCHIDAPEDSHGVLKDHRQQLIDYADQMGFYVVGISQDLADGLNLNRTGLNEVMQAAKAGQIDVAVIHSKICISRDENKVIVYINRLHNCGVKLYSPLEGEILLQ